MKERLKEKAVEVSCKVVGSTIGIVIMSSLLISHDTYEFYKRIKKLIKEIL